MGAVRERRSIYTTPHSAPPPEDRRREKRFAMTFIFQRGIAYNTPMRLSVVESRPASPTGCDTGPRSISASKCVLCISITDQL